MQSKPAFNNERMVIGEHLPLDTPLSVILDVSERCNFKCRYCFRAGEKNDSWGFAAKTENMTMETFKLSVRQLAEFPDKIKSISLSGHGEPLCNPHLADMAGYLKQSGITQKIDMHTNASLFTEDNVKALARAGFTRIVISLQGLNQNAYEKVCGFKINWEQFYNNLKLLFEYKNKDTYIHIKIMDIALDGESKETFYNLFAGISDSVFVEKTVPLWKNIKNDLDQTKNKYGEDVGNINFCPLVFYKIVIAPDGGIHPCTGLPTPFDLGNIRDVTIKEAWNSTKRAEFLKEHLKLTRNGQEFCADCFVPVNSVLTKEDNIDSFKEKILLRIENKIESNTKNN